MIVTLLALMQVQEELVAEVVELDAFSWTLMLVSDISRPHRAGFR